MSIHQIVVRDFVRDVLNHQGDALSKKIYRESHRRCRELVLKLEITEKTIGDGVKVMADEIFQNHVKYCHVLVLLTFCIELDKQCKLKQFDWYSKELLVKNVIDILCDVKFIPPSRSNNTCTII